MAEDTWTEEETQNILFNNRTIRYAVGEYITFGYANYTNPEGITKRLPRMGIWNVSRVTNMESLFNIYYYIRPEYDDEDEEPIQNNFNEDISNWDVSNVIDMAGMFEGASKFNHPLYWNVSRVQNMARMFKGATRFNCGLRGPGGGGPWDVRNVQDMSNMFEDASRFNQPLSWDVSNVENMTEMFKGASNFNQPLHWDVLNVRYMANMFNNARSFNSLLRGKYNQEWNVSNVIDMFRMFYGAINFNKPLDGWILSSVTDMREMFKDARSFNQPLNRWDVSSVTDMRSMFKGAINFDQPLDRWDVSHVKRMDNMFDGASRFSRNLSSWNLDGLRDGILGRHRIIRRNNPLYIQLMFSGTAMSERPELMPRVPIRQEIETIQEEAGMEEYSFELIVIDGNQPVHPATVQVAPIMPHEQVNPYHAHEEAGKINYEAVNKKIIDAGVELQPMIGNGSDQIISMLRLLKEELAPLLSPKLKRDTDIIIERLLLASWAFGEFPVITNSAIQALNYINLFDIDSKIFYLETLIHDSINAYKSNNPEDAISCVKGIVERIIYQITVICSGKEEHNCQEILRLIAGIPTKELLNNYINEWLQEKSNSPGTLTSGELKRELTNYLKNKFRQLTHAEVTFIEEYVDTTWDSFYNDFFTGGRRRSRKTKRRMIIRKTQRRTQRRKGVGKKSVVK